MSETPAAAELSTSPEAAAKPRQIQRLQSQEEGATGRKRGDSTGDSRWRTSSFTEPARVIVIAVDASANSKNAFDFYVKQMHRPDDLLVITHIPEPPKLPSFSFRGGLNVPAEKWKGIMDDANARVTKLQSDYEDECLHKKLRYKIRGESSTKTGQAICDAADQENADCIIIACRGLGMIKKAMLGSVSDYVVRHANRPVLVVPMKK